MFEFFFPLAVKLAGIVVVLCLPSQLMADRHSAEALVLRDGDAILVRPNGVTQQQFRSGWRFYVVSKQGLFRNDHTLVCDGANNPVEFPVNLVGKDMVEAAQIIKAELKKKKVIPDGAGVAIEVYRKLGSTSK